jgi:hypothetical protein
MQAAPPAYTALTKAATIETLYRGVTHEPDMPRLGFLYHIHYPAPAVIYLSGLRGAVFRWPAIYRISQIKVPVQLYLVRQQALHQQLPGLTHKLYALRILISAGALTYT